MKIVKKQPVEAKSYSKTLSTVVKLSPAVNNFPEKKGPFQFSC